MNECKYCEKEIKRGDKVAIIHKDCFNKIADLEAKLAVAKKTIEVQRKTNDALMDENLDFRNDITDVAIEQAKRMAEDWEFGYKEEIKELKQQLAEKEKEIDELKQRLKDTIKIYSDDFVEKDKELKELRFKARNIFPLVENLEDKVNQDKISFCIEKLSELKKWCQEHSYYVEECCGDVESEYYEEYVYQYINIAELCEEIDNQIEELKNGSEQNDK